MPIDRVPLSASQLAELLGVDATRLLDVVKTSTGFALLLEPEDADGRTDRRIISATPDRQEGRR